jgi:hypothetical protein
MKQIVVSIRVLGSRLPRIAIKKKAKERGRLTEFF